MYEDDEINETGEFVGIGTEPFYMFLTASAWKMFIKYGENNCDLESEKRLMNAAKAVFDTLEESDRKLLKFYGERKETREYCLAGYSYETGIPRQQIRQRFYYLCYLLAVQLKLINCLVWIPPPENDIIAKKGRIKHE